MAQRGRDSLDGSMEEGGGKEMAPYKKGGFPNLKSIFHSVFIFVYTFSGRRVGGLRLHWLRNANQISYGML